MPPLTPAAAAADPALIRAAALFAPALALVAALALRRPTAADTAAAVVATAWSAATVFALNIAALRLGWWTFDAHGAVVRGVPADLWLGWSLLWGALPAVLIRTLPATLVVAVLAWLDLILMPPAEPVVRLGGAWLLGEGAGIAACLVPAVALARWTRLDRHRPVRAAA
ncbi:hypothetical protein [Streptomonospora salina]|uniref:Uncharacterized protein n=1 Tax=Streptomonospora salina TaxID=104205 RepID=A0A841DYF2_9ACTN|nr:hypothetical protein [Streptomonospora salina]MBB5996467.1 hypothetical protein [Streptomonospora salina]